MKIQSFLSLLLVGLCINVFTIHSGTDGFREIGLKGELDWTGSRVAAAPMSAQSASASTQKTVVAYQSDDAIHLSFTKAVGTVEVKVTDQAGLEVYNVTVDVNDPAQSQLLIYTGGYESGTYLLELKAARGYMCGEFYVE